MILYLTLCNIPHFFWHTVRRHTAWRHTVFAYIKNIVTYRSDVYTEYCSVCPGAGDGMEFKSDQPGAPPPPLPPPTVNNKSRWVNLGREYRHSSPAFVAQISPLGFD
jgi:hypothetical protein